jgi:phospholipid/cholesterol/gamma-HCH transport system permease protein
MFTQGRIMSTAQFHIEQTQETCLVYLTGDWKLGQAPGGDVIYAAIPPSSTSVRIITQDLGQWDSSLAIALMQLAHWGDTKQISLDTTATPEGLQQLLKLASGVPAYQSTTNSQPGGFSLQLSQKLHGQWQSLRNTLTFVGDTSIALNQWLRGDAKTRRSDIAFFIVQAGPRALAIVTLIAL